MGNVFLEPNLVWDNKGRVRAHHAALIFTKNKCFSACKTKVFACKPLVVNIDSYCLEFAFKSVGSSRNVYFSWGMCFSNRTWFGATRVGCAHTMRLLYSRKTVFFLLVKLRFLLVNRWL